MDLLYGNRTRGAEDSDKVFGDDFVFRMDVPLFRVEVVLFIHFF